MGGGLFSEPVLYNSQQRVPPPPITRYPEEPSWPRVASMDYDYRGGVRGRDPYADYPIGYADEGLVRNGPSVLSGGTTPPPPPEKVAKAIDTVVNYMSGKYVENATSSTVKVETTTPTPTTTTTSTTTTTTTTTASTTPNITSVTSKPHPKKPTSSHDEASEENSDGRKTISGVLENYGVAKRNVGFILDAVFVLFLSVVMFFCLCYNPREPRSASSVTSEDKRKDSCIFQYTFTVLLFFFSLLHWGMFVSFGQVLPEFTILGGDEDGRHLQSVVMGIFVATRFVSMFTCSFLSSPALLVFGSLSVTMAGSIVLVFAQSLSATAVWAGVILQSIGLANLLPASLVWGEAYVKMSSPLVAVVCSGLAWGELVVPQLFTRLTVEAQTWLGFAMLGATTLASGLFACVFLMAKRHGSRGRRPQTLGYELARQDEMNQELLEDEDDFEVSEPTLRLNSIDPDDIEA